MTGRTDERESLSMLARVKDFVGIVAGVVAVAVGLTQVLVTDRAVFGGVLIIVGIAIIVWLLLVQAYRSRTDAWAQAKRCLVLAWIITIPLAVVIAGGWMVYEHVRPPSEYVVLVAKFDGPDEQKYQVGRFIMEGLTEVTAKYDDVRIKPIEQAFAESAAAQSAGRARKAGMIVWGWYAHDQVTTATLHIEVLRGPKSFVAKVEETRPETDLRQMQMQLQLAHGASFFTLLTLGVIRFDVGDFTEAVNLFTAALERPLPRNQPVHAVLWGYRGLANSLIGQQQDAIEDFDAALEVMPNRSDLLVNRGIARFMTGEYDRAEQDYDRAIEIEPRLAAAYGNRGNVYLVTGRTDLALRDFDYAIELEPIAAYFEKRGVARASSGDDHGAIRDYSKAIELDSNYTVAYFHRATSYRRVGRWNDAQRDFQRVLELTRDLALRAITEKMLRGEDTN